MYARFIQRVLTPIVGLAVVLLLNLAIYSVMSGNRTLGAIAFALMTVLTVPVYVVDRCASEQEALDQDVRRFVRAGR